ncbi:MAG: SUMF1/EgtB/PvdO family nonheme iron enzyme [Bacteroidota bacterium]
MRRRLLLVLPLLSLCLAVEVHAQSIQIENVRVHLADRDTTAQTVPVTFEVAWEGSWRNGESWDAVWLFAKFEREPGVWGDLRFVASGASAEGNVPMSLSSSVLPAGHANGLVLHQAADGQGNVQVTVQATWTYGASYFDLPEDGVSVRILGVELVHVPGGPFEVGEAAVDSLRQPNAFRAADGGTFRVVSEDEIAVGAGPSALYYNVPDGEAYVGGDQAGPILAAFPKGAAPFYVMKYPVTQGQYADFLALLPLRARAARDITAYPSYADEGGTISCGDDGCAALQPDRAANFLSWADGIGWASWAGLRPMTELEYEKAAAGTPADSARYADGALPERVGASERRSRWGAVDLRGGLWERVVSVGTPEGRAFRGTPGQGYVDDLGYPYGFVNADWPGPRALGSGYRGGTEGLLALSEVADRTYGAYEASYGNAGQGFRAVLDAP